MKRPAIIIGALICASTIVHADVYVVLYATYQGRTGHCGIAIDDYEIHVKEETKSGTAIYSYDTVSTGTLLYFDLWPLQDELKARYDGEVASKYYKLPSSHWKNLISLRTLGDEGIPHKYGYPCDALVAISSSKAKDLTLVHYLDQIIRQSRPFNAMHYNCCDFVIDALGQITDRKIDAKEYVVTDMVSTPNMLYRVVSKWPEAQVLKDPGSKMQGSFTRERLLGGLIPTLSIF